jgi:hypothetical protein
MKRTGCALRWLFALGCLYLCFRLTRSALGIQSIASFHAAPLLVVAFGLFFAALLLTSKEVIIPLSELVGGFFISFLHPNARFSKPPLSYILARSYARQMRYTEAFEEYKKIVHYYPNELEAYREIIAVCNAAGAGKLAHRYEKKFRRRFPKEALDLNKETLPNTVPGISDS